VVVLGLKRLTCVMTAFVGVAVWAVLLFPSHVVLSVSDGHLSGDKLETASASWVEGVLEGAPLLVQVLRQPKLQVVERVLASVLIAVDRSVAALASGQKCWMGHLWP